VRIRRRFRLGKDFGVQHEKVLRELEARWIDIPWIDEFARDIDY